MELIKLVDAFGNEPKAHAGHRFYKAGGSGKGARSGNAKKKKKGSVKKAPPKKKVTAKRPNPFRKNK